MGRIKGSKLSEATKAKMAAGRKKQIKKLESEMEVEKPSKDLIAGYGLFVGENHPLPIFTSEASTFKGTVYKTYEEAKSAM